MQLLLCLVLVGCPNKEYYKTSGEPLRLVNIDIKPGKVFYDEFKEGFTSSIIMTITNKSAQNVDVDLRESYIKDPVDTFKIRNLIFELGHLVTSDTSIFIDRNSSKMFALHFEDNYKHFKSNVQLIIPNRQGEHISISYKRLRD